MVTTFLFLVSLFSRRNLGLVLYGKLVFFLGCFCRGVVRAREWLRKPVRRLMTFVLAARSLILLPPLVLKLVVIAELPRVEWH